MKKTTSRLLTTAAAVAFAGALAGSASAFEVVDWNWTANIVEDWDIDVVISVDYDPTGIVKIEKLQMHFGDVKSFAKVWGIENSPPVGTVEGGSLTFNEIFNVPVAYEDATDPDSIVPSNSIQQNGINLQILGGTVDEGQDTITQQIQVSGELTADDIEGVSIDLAALPEVINKATSVANNQQIISSSALMLHDAQIAVGDINDITDRGEQPDAIAFLIAAYGLTLVDDQLDGINEHTDLAVLAILGAATGFIDPAEIEATALAFWIDNATVDNSATAVGNNASYEVTTDIPANGTMIADLTQLLIGDVDATAVVAGVDISNYDLTDIEVPIVNNVATAVGNNLNIKVGAPDIEQGGGGG
jgi:hypothetical protein